MIVSKCPGVIIDKYNNNYILNINKQDITKKIIDNIPYVYTQPHGTNTLVYLPIVEDTLKILRNIGMNTEGMEPFYFQYQPPLIEGRYHPMAHQLTSAAFMSSRERVYNTSTMRTGKTGSVVLATDYLQSIGKIQGAVLIVATVSNLTGVWQKTINDTLPDKTCVVVHGGVGKADRLKKLKYVADYYVINYDGVKMVQDELVAMVKSGKISCVVVDELTHYGNIKSQRWKALDSIVNGSCPVKYCWGLTGSPGGDSMAVFGFMKLINPVKLPCERLTTWQGLVQYRWGMAAWQWKDKPEAPAIISKAMQPTIRFDKKDIMDLPPIVYQVRDCELTSEQHKAYKQMRDEMIALTDKGELIEAVHKASMMHKLFQIVLGSVISNGKLLELDNKPRFNTILEIIKEASQKVVIFSPYTGAIDKLVSQLKANKYTVNKVDGSITGKRRAEIFNDFQYKKDPHILVCQIETVAYGVELAAADTMIFNGPPLSGGFIYEQALERLSSMKQKAKQISIIQLAATPEERKFFAGLDAGVKQSELVNDLFVEITRR